MSVAVSVEQVLARGFQDMSEEERRSWNRFADSASLLYREIDTALTAKHDLAIRDVRILQQLSADPSSPVRMGVLAETLVVSPSRVTWLVTRLEDRGLVGRARSRKDRRIVVVAITRKGEDHLRLALRTYADLVRQYYLGSLTRDQMTALGDSASRLSGHLRHQD